MGMHKGGMAYRPEDWRERGIRARRFLPCPHCGCAVSGRERIYTPPGGGAQAVFRSAKCKNNRCGWRYFKHEGSREDFVAEVNRRIKAYGDGD